MNMGFQATAGTMSEAAVDARAAFITRTYTHVFGAILLFTVIEVAMFANGAAYTIANALLGTSWLLVLAAFMVIGWLARRTAHSTASPAALYGAFFGFVAAQAIIFIPLLVMAEVSVGGGVIQSAAVTTLMGFTGLTAVAFVTRKDFSFLRGMIMWGGVLALVMIVAAILFGFQLGTYFSLAMVGLAGAAILYDTSNIIHHYPTDRHVAASIELFASVALMFWYVLRLFMSRD